MRSDELIAVQTAFNVRSIVKEVMVQFVHFNQIGISFFVEYVVDHVEVWLRQWMKNDGLVANCKFLVLQEVIEAISTLDTSAHQFTVACYVQSYNFV